MKVSKWGNSLAIRLSREMVQKMGVKEGDEIYTIPGMAEDGAVTIARKLTWDERMARLREISRQAQWPVDFKFNREEMYEEHMDNRWKTYDELP